MVVVVVLTAPEPAGVVVLVEVCGVLAIPEAPPVVGAVVELVFSFARVAVVLWSVVAEWKYFATLVRNGCAAAGGGTLPVRSCTSGYLLLIVRTASMTRLV